MARLNHLLAQVEAEMERYHLYNVVPALLDFIEDLTNTYIRLNRGRFWDTENSENKETAYQTLYDVLYTFSKVMAPFTPFMAELIFENLKSVDKKAKESVHLEDYPTVDKEFLCEELEKSVHNMQQVMIMGRNLREKAKVKVKIPLKRLTIVHHDEQTLESLKELEGYIKDELNIREVEYSKDEEKYIVLSAKANGAVLGPRLGKNFRAVSSGIENLDSQKLFQLESGEAVEIEGEKITADDVNIYRNPQEGHEFVASNIHVTVEIDATVDEDQKLEGLAREVVNRIQKLRKAADLKLDQRIKVQYFADGNLAKAVSANQDYIQEQVLADEVVAQDKPAGEHQEEYDIEKEVLKIALSAV